jgi:predicted amidohydrolase
LRLALAQLDSTLGDVEANAGRAREALRDARAGGADLVVFPELQLSGYALGGADRETAVAASELPALVGAGAGGDVTALVGFHEREGESRFNSAAYVERGALVHVHRKLYLPHYLDFEERSVFAPGDELRAFDTAHGRFATLICNDAWQPFLPPLAVADGAQVLLVPSASSTAVAEAEPYWRDITRFYARLLECYVVFANRVGTEPGFTFWGGSHVVDPHGDVVAEAPRFEEALLFAELDLGAVESRRRELPLLGDLRPDLLRRELDRLSGR